MLYSGHDTDNGVMISLLQWLLTMGQYKPTQVNKSIIDGGVSQTALLFYDEQWDTDGF